MQLYIIHLALEQIVRPLADAQRLIVRNVPGSIAQIRGPAHQLSVDEQFQPVSTSNAGHVPPPRFQRHVVRYALARLQCIHLARGKGAAEQLSLEDGHRPYAAIGDIWCHVQSLRHRPPGATLVAIYLAQRQRARVEGAIVHGHGHDFLFVTQLTAVFPVLLTVPAIDLRLGPRTGVQRTLVGGEGVDLIYAFLVTGVGPLVSTFIRVDAAVTATLVPCADQMAIKKSHRHQAAPRITTMGPGRTPVIPIDPPVVIGHGVQLTVEDGQISRRIHVVLRPSLQALYPIAVYVEVIETGCRDLATVFPCAATCVAIDPSTGLPVW